VSGAIKGFSIFEALFHDFMSESVAKNVPLCSP